MAYPQSLPPDAGQTLLHVWVEHTPVAIAIVDPHLHYQTVSRRWRDDHQWGDRALIGHSHLDFFPEDAAQWEAVRQRGLAGETVSWESITPARSGPTGPSDWVRWTVYPWQLTEGHIGGLTIVSEIITDRKQAEEERDRFFNLIPDMLCIVGFDGYFKQINPAWERVLGYSAEELMARPLIEWVHPDDQAKTRTVTVAMTSGHVIPPFENRYRCKDGSYRWFSWLGTPCLRTNCIYATARDISNLKQSEVDLKETKRFLESVLNYLPVAVMAKEVEGLRFALWNPAAENILGRDAADMLGKTVYDLFPKAFGDMLTAQDHAVLRSRQMLDLPEEEVRLENGEIRILHTKKTVILDAKEEPQYILAIAEDVTDHKQAQSRLQSQEHFLRSIYDGVEYQIFVTDVTPEGAFRCAGWNRLAEQATGRSLQDALGKTPIELFGELEGQAVEQRFQNCIKLGIAITYEEQMTFQGEETWWLTTITPLRNEAGRIYRLVGTSLDIGDRKRTEQALQDNQQFIERVAYSSPGILYIYDFEKNQNVYTNRGLSDLLGYSDSQVEALGNDLIQSITHPDDLPLIFQHHQMMRAIADGEIRELDYRLRRANGDWIWLHSRDTVFKRDRTTGAVIQILGTAQDITDRKQAEAALLASQQRISLLIQQTPLGVIEWDINSYVQAWNPAAEEIFGYPAEVAIGKHFSFLLDESLQSLVSHIFAELLEQTGGTRSINVNITHDGRTILCEWYNTPLVAPNGETIGVASLVHDVTDRIEAETALQEREERLRTINTSVPGVIYQYEVNLDTGGDRFTYMSSRTLELFELDPSLLVEQPELVWALIHPDDLDRVQHQVATSLQNHTSWHDEFRITTPSGQTKWIRAQAESASTFDHCLVHNGVMIDISERKAAEAALQASESELRHTLDELKRAQMRMVQGEKMSSLGQLVAGVAHEINNPVNFIYGNITHANSYARDLLDVIHLYQKHYPNPCAEIVDEIKTVDLDFVAEDLPKLLHSMKVGADRIRDIVASLRTFSRMDEAAMKDVDLHEGIDSTIVILNNRLRTKDDRPAIEIIREYGDIPRIECHAGQINQVFMNLLSNAIDALEDQCHQQSIVEDFVPRITIQTALVGGQKAQIIFSDNGSGIPESVRQRIFDPFFTTKPVGKGTGMGLSISYQIITETHGGTLECVSNLDQGTTFIIQIPLHQAPQRRAKSPLLPPLPASPEA